jgi:hypothetical protein
MRSRFRQSSRKTLADGGLAGLEVLGGERAVAALLLQPGDGVGEDRRLLERAAHPQADGEHDGGEPERHAPAPRLELRVVERVHPGEHEGDEDLRGEAAGVRPRRVEAAVPRVGGLEHDDHRPAPLAADGEALDEPEHDEQRRREEADRVVGRQEADEQGPGPHDREREDERGLAPLLVAATAEEHAAQRAGQEPDGERAEGRQRGDERVLGREEHGGEDDRGGGAVDEEVVVLERVADEARERDLPGVPPARERGRGCGDGHRCSFGAGFR